MMRRLIVGLLLGGLGLVSAHVAHADERILEFHSDIRVFDDRSMEVEETIRVRAEGRNIRRGIYRDFPTTYKDTLGNRYRVGFELLHVSRDGQPEAHHLENLSNGVRIYAGSRDRVLSPGDHTFVFRYRTDRQLGFFEAHDELYWNVTGNDWAFPIDAASATVMLPSQIPAAEISIEGYTGAVGDRGRNYESGVGVDGAAHIQTTGALARRHGLTLVVSWPKGYIEAPTRTEKLGHVLRDNRHLIAAAIGVVLLLLYYLGVWHRFGRDPEPGVIIPHYTPPNAYSPASTRYIARMGYDHRAFATAILNLAVQGLITIDKEDGDYTLRRTDKEPDELAPGERVLLHKLLGTRRSIELDKANHEILSKAIRAHKDSLKADYGKLYFVTNRAWLVPGGIITAMTLALVLWLSPGRGEGAGLAMMLWLTFWTVGVVVLVTTTLSVWRGASSFGGLVRALIGILFIIPFIAAEGIGAFVLGELSSVSTVIVLVVVVAINAVFYFLLKAPTLAGRQLMDKLEGFKLYLEVAEKDELDLRNPPDKTPELFERYLPFALALGVEQAWAEKFAGVFARFREREGRDYHPVWYHGRWDSRGVGRFASSFGGSLTSAVAASSRAPGSSSGSGGGGFSGGGGGGGGGGGW